MRCVHAIALLFSIAVTNAFAEDGVTPHTEVIPELYAYWSLNKSARLVFLAAVTNDRDVEHRDVDYAAFVDVFVPRFRAVLFRRISVADDSRVSRITIRAGYRHIRSVSDRPPNTEHRLETDATLRWALLGNVLLSDRNRGEIRFIKGDFSWRYRNRLRMERDFKLGKLPVTPYISAELYYDSRYDTVSRWRYEAGASFTFGKHWVLEPYYERKIVKQPGLELTNGIGFTVSFYAR